MFVKFFSSRTLIIILISTILLLAMVGLTYNQRQDLTWPEKFLKDSLSLVQRLFYKPANAFAGFLENIQEIARYKEENKILKYSLLSYAEVAAENNKLNNENKRLREMLNFKTQEKNYQLIPAEVIFRNPEQWNNSLIIDRGANDGVKINMPVITPSGLVGKIYSVTPFTAEVQLISDLNNPGFIFAKILSEPFAYGVVESYDEKKKLLAVKKIPIDVPLKVGQKVITSKLGGVFPDGLLIGEIKEVTVGEYGLTQTAWLKPAVDLYRLEQLFIVVNKPGE